MDVPMEVVKGASDWWQEVNNSVVWQDRIFHTLAVLFGLVSAVALVNSLFFSLFFVFV